MATRLPGWADVPRTAAFATIFTPGDEVAEERELGRREHPEVATTRAAPKTNQAPIPYARQERVPQLRQRIASIPINRVSNALGRITENLVSDLSSNCVRRPGIPIPFTGPSKTANNVRNWKNQSIYSQVKYCKPPLPGTIARLLLCICHSNSLHHSLRY